MIGRIKTTAILAAIALAASGGVALAQPKGKGPKGNGNGQTAPITAPAAPPSNVADCSFYEIEASNGTPSVDKALKPLSKKLRKPPFSSWKTFKLLKRHAKQLEKMKSFALPLVTGSKLGLIYRDRDATNPAKKVRLRFTFTLDDKSDKRMMDGTIKVDSGDYYLIGGQQTKAGATYIIAVSCQ